MMPSRPLVATLLALFIVITATGCATLPPAAQQYASFSDYAEAVFRHQNQLISQIMMLEAQGSPLDDEDLKDAEHAMFDACHLLNEYAEREADGDSISWLFKRRVQNSIAACDDSIREFEAVLAPLQHN